VTADAKRPFPDLPETIETIHIIGVCGTAMGSLAAMLKERGFTVRGSDAMAYPPMSTWLESRGIDIMQGYKASNLDWDPDLVIVGNVVRAEYADAEEMRRRGLPHLSLPEALKHFFFRDKRTLVVTGTHGKTTTSSMLAWIMAQSKHDQPERDPGFMIGGITGNFDSNYRLSDGGVFVLEGDEYDTAYFDKVPKFWHYDPFRATINNIEFDHADIYPDIDAIEMVFERFVDMLPADGSLWVNGDDERALGVSEHSKAERKTFGLGEHNDLFARDIKYGTTTTAEVVFAGDSLGTFELPCVGEFNVRNMLGATGIALDEGVGVDVIKGALRGFKTVKKRQELVGEVNGVRVIDDFAHHPTAVRATVEALRERYPDRRLWAIFEAKSNTSRRRVFQDDYPPALAKADFVILSKPFQKKDNLAPAERIDIDQMAETIRALGPETTLIPEVDAIVDYVVERVESGDIIAGLSGSAFGGLHQKLVAALQEKWS
jgi:UDP-N-acetylmuramate: L-alanyl-gamma-D-glutamyl-meso-diaminopimelate ligase